jgi:hypothetical protein
MTVRPLDWGDPYPSDIGDVPPGNPTDGFIERDYRIRQRSVRGIPARPDASASPDMRTERERPEPRPVFMGIVVRREERNTYTVLRQDGRRMLGYTRGDSDEYDALSPGETVSMIADQRPGIWLIEGSERRKEMASLRLANASDIETEMETIIPLVALINETGADDEGINPVVRMGGGGVRVLKEFNGQYEISVSVNVEYIDPEADLVGNQIRFRAACIAEPTGTPADLTAGVFTFDRSVGFSLGWDAGNCDAKLTMRISETDYMMYSPSGGGRVVWTNNPKIAGCLEVGTNAAIGWLKLVAGTGGSYTWLGNGNGRLKIRFPDRAGENHSHFYVSGVEGDAVKLKFTKPGGTGKICMYDDYGSLKEWVVDKGIIISGPCIESAPSTGDPVVANDTPRQDWECSADTN